MFPLELPGERLCGFYDEPTCMFYFVYNELRKTVRVQRVKECSVPANIAGKYVDLGQLRNGLLCCIWQESSWLSSEAFF